jgi:hypothetical protein
MIGKQLGLRWDIWSKRICLAIFWKFRQSESSFQWHCEVRSFQIIQTSVFFQFRDEISELLKFPEMWSLAKPTAFQEFL